LGGLAFAGTAGFGHTGERSGAAQSLPAPTDTVALNCSQPRIAYLVVAPLSANVSPLENQMFSASALDSCGGPMAEAVSFSWWLSSPSLGLLNSSEGPAVAYSACLAPMSGILHVEASSGGITVFANSTIAVTLQNPGWQDPSQGSTSGTAGGGELSGLSEGQRYALGVAIPLLAATAAAVVLYGRRKGRGGEGGP